MNKEEFVRTFFDKPIEDFVITQTDLDETDLSIADILRNINRIYPPNSRDRNKIASGEMVVSVICRSDLIDPMKGIILMITSSDMELKRDMISKYYIVLLISERDITSAAGIKKVTDVLLSHMVKKYNKVLPSLDKFYAKYVYNEDELLFSRSGEYLGDEDTDLYG